ncbi:MAG: hypothetical protein JW941_10145 [Candidatus Coatesbacteria bacterium]|nr:hypothetical protein [Candidatus Coatesbacteria bacterium]
MTEIDYKKLKDLSRGMSRDMSPEAVSKRLKKVANLRNLCLMLGKAGKAAREERRRVQGEAEE